MITTIDKKIEIVKALFLKQELPDYGDDCFIVDLIAKTEEYDLRFDLIRLAERYKEIFILSPEFIFVADRIANANITLVVRPV